MLKRGFQFAPGYRLQEFLGRGQFGQVWRATAPGGAATAVKFIDLSDGQGQREYEAVKRVKQVRHANLMPITAIWLLDAQAKVIEEAPDEAIETIDLSAPEPKGQSALYRSPAQDPSWLVVAMLLGGKSLLQRLRECVGEGLPGIPPKELISYMDESAKGIDFLNAPQHDLGEGPIAIQHSDIKPANIVLIGSSAVVCDFGLARILTRNQVTATSAAGTPAYMAPEAISGKPSRTSDQYSLAVTYYHLRTGNLPFTDGSLWEVLDVHRQGKLKFVEVPEAERQVLRKATDLDWEKRFESSVEMVDALREALRLEGHTKPGFVPNSGVDARAAVPGGDTKAVEGDPTAARDVSIAGRAASPDLQPTEPLVQADELTRTVAAQSATKAQLLLESIRRNPRLTAAIGSGGVILVLIAAMAFRSTVSTSTPQADRGGSGINVVPPETESESDVAADPNVLLREALAVLDTNEQDAVAKFRCALELTPGLLPELEELKGHEGSIMQMLQTPDGMKLVTMADGPTAFLWDLASGSQSPTPLAGHDRLLNTLAISPHGERLLTGGSDDIARVWNLNASDVVSSCLELKGHEDKIEAVAWHPARPVAATASADEHLGIWEIASASQASPHGTIVGRRIPIQETLIDLVSSRDGQWLAARTLGTDLVETNVDVLVYSWQELIKVDGSPPPIRLGAKTAKRIAFLSGDNGAGLAIGDVGGTVSIYSISDQGVVKREPVATNADVEALRVVHVDQHDVIVTGSSDGSVHWWKYGERPDKKARVFSPEWGVGCVDVARDGRWVAAGSNNGFVWLWDTHGEQEQGVIRLISGADSVDSVLIDVRSQWLIAGCSDGVVRMWDLKLAKLLALARPTSPQDTLHGPTNEINAPPFAMR